jgi:hypothetical protein
MLDPRRERNPVARVKERAGGRGSPVRCGWLVVARRDRSTRLARRREARPIDAAGSSSRLHPSLRRATLQLPSA